jgi:hypothetical protein
MVMKLSTSSGSSEDVRKAGLDFLGKLLEMGPKKPKTLRLSGVWMCESLFALLSSKKIRPDWLQMACSLPRLPTKYDNNSLSGLKKLHLELEEKFNLHDFPLLPDSLEELSIHFSNLRNRRRFSFSNNCGYVENCRLIDYFWVMDPCTFIGHCKDLKKM